ncbi:MAG: hypothetical protein AB8U25_03835 [Rickettsiales endosymbiont of Dermacentor nuttalli]
MLLVSNIVLNNVISVNKAFITLTITNPYLGVGADNFYITQILSLIPTIILHCIIVIGGTCSISKQRSRAVTLTQAIVCLLGMLV